MPRREPLTAIVYKLRQMTYARKCHYLIVCRDCEIEGSPRWRWMQEQLETLRLAQLRQENRNAEKAAAHAY